VSGDVGKSISGGQNKRIVWDVLSDVEKLQGDWIKFRVKASIVPPKEIKQYAQKNNVKRTYALPKSIALPGWGQVSKGGSRANWIWLPIVAVPSVGSLTFLQQSFANYKKYKDEKSSRSVRSDHYNKSIQYYSYSKILGYTGLGLYSACLIQTMIKRNRGMSASTQKKLPNWSLSPSFYPGQASATVVVRW
jgi:hypothetical protein